MKNANKKTPKQAKKKFTNKGIERRDTKLKTTTYFQLVEIDTEGTEQRQLSACRRQHQ